MLFDVLKLTLFSLHCILLLAKRRRLKRRRRPRKLLQRLPPVEELPVVRMKVRYEVEL